MYLNRRHYMFVDVHYYLSDWVPLHQGLAGQFIHTVGINHPLLPGEHPMPGNSGIVQITGAVSDGATWPRAEVT